MELEVSYVSGVFSPALKKRVQVWLQFECGREIFSARKPKQTLRYTSLLWLQEMEPLSCW